MSFVSIGENPNCNNIIKKSGRLTISKKPLTIAAESASKTYDGTPLTKSTYTISGVKAEAKATNAGAYTVNIVGTPAIVDSEGTDETALNKQGAQHCSFGHYHVTATCQNEQCCAPCSFLVYSTKPRSPLCATQIDAHLEGRNEVLRELRLTRLPLVLFVETSHVELAIVSNL